MAKTATRETGIWAGREIRTRFSLRLAFQGDFPDLTGNYLINLSAALTASWGVFGLNLIIEGVGTSVKDTMQERWVIGSHNQALFQSGKIGLTTLIPVTYDVP